MNGELIFSRIIKRNGENVDFNPEKIEYAIFKAMRAIGSPDRKKANELCLKVLEQLERICKANIPSVEQVQDQVELVLFEHGDFRLIKAYILYRKQRELSRNTKELFTNIEVMDEYLSMGDWRIKESAPVLRTF